ncbi:hypothetical protein TNCV_4775781 [Trichonephila clavipes]|nr:hypothetical protein TNCV_4775781 [Trichonephila clavipes]
MGNVLAFVRNGRHLVGFVIRARRLENCVICVRRLDNCVICVTQLVAFAVDRWRHDSGARSVWFRSRPGSPMKERGSFWVPSVPNECKYVTDHAKTIVFT